MQVTRINEWLDGSELRGCLRKKNILDWLQEEGSITAKISSKAKFKLEILNDDIGIAEDEEYVGLNIASEEVRIREVVLYGNLVPLVFARSIIPNQIIIKVSKFFTEIIYTVTKSIFPLWIIGTYYSNTFIRI